MNYNTRNKVGTVIGTLIGAFLFAFIEPFLFFWLGYFVGWLSKLMIGTHLITGLQLIHIPIELNQIPLLAGTLAWVGSFFYQLDTKKNK